MKPSGVGRLFDSPHHSCFGVLGSPIIFNINLPCGHTAGTFHHQTGIFGKWRNKKVLFLVCISANFCITGIHYNRRGVHGNLFVGGHQSRTNRLRLFFFFCFFFYFLLLLQPAADIPITPVRAPDRNSGISLAIFVVLLEEERKPDASGNG